jgi:NADH-quinone oxidoreductase subunit C
MTMKLDTLQATLHNVLGDKIVRLDRALGELTLTVKAGDYFQVASTLRDEPSLAFEQLMDVCGMDYSAYKDGAASIYSEGPRFCVVSHLLSISKNWRVRLKTFAVDDDFPIVASITPLWSVRWPRRLAPHPDRLWLHRAPFPQGLPDTRSRRNALRPRAAARDLPTRVHRVA